MNVSVMAHGGCADVPVGVTEDLLNSEIYWASLGFKNVKLNPDLDKYSQDPVVITFIQAVSPEYAELLFLRDAPWRRQKERF